MNANVTAHLRILLIEDNPGDARFIHEMLAEARGATFTVELPRAARA